MHNFHILFIFSYFEMKPFFYLVNGRILYKSAIIHISSLLCYVTINIVKCFWIVLNSFDLVGREYMQILIQLLGYLNIYHTK